MFLLCNALAPSASLQPECELTNHKAHGFQAQRRVAIGDLGNLKEWL